MTVAAAIDYLVEAGVPIYEAPPKFKARGFAYYAPSVGQMLTVADLLVFAANDRELRDSV